MPALIQPTPSPSPSHDTQDNISCTYDVTNNGFLPSPAPIARLEDSYYETWEFLAKNLPFLLKSQLLRRCVDGCTVLSTDRLVTEGDWRRAYVILVFLAHGYIWGGETPSEVSTAPKTGLYSPVSSV